jgi:dTDP-4-dehydrorhamnose 3,5-epimerase-like enzyme
MLETYARPGEPNAGIWKEIVLPRIHHEFGGLCFGEAKRHIPFEIARFFFIFDIPSHATRGSHAHKSISQVIFALRGSFSIDLENGQEHEQVRLEHPERGLLVGPMVWKGISDYEDGSVCLVMASGFYDENEYLRDRSDWVAELEGGR